MSGAVIETLPMVSVVIVAHNSQNYLRRCLPALLAQDIPCEIIIVDNNSTDGTVAWLHACYPDVHVRALDHNTWYAGGNNLGLWEARGTYVLVLNPDTELRPGALSELVRVAELHRCSFVTAKLLLPDGAVNACGNDMHYTGITTCLGLGQDADGFHGVTQPFLLSGAAILATREAWHDVEGFDESFGMYMEDADLSLRARLKGYDILCAADAEIVHDYRLGMSPEKFYFLERNILITQESHRIPLPAHLWPTLDPHLAPSRTVAQHTSRHPGDPP